MSKELNLKVEKDFLISLAANNAINAISELLWNSLDADAKNIQINYSANDIGGIDHIEIIDDGHGIDFSSIEETFGKLGGSSKKREKYSPKNRILHGKEGKGRYKAFSLGNMIIFNSKYTENSQTRTFDIELSIDNLNHPVVSDLRDSENGYNTGVCISIENINDRVIGELLSDSFKLRIEEKFAVYHYSYPDFTISINGEALSFSDSINELIEESFVIQSETQEALDFKLKIIEWNIACDKTIYFGATSGVIYDQDSLGMRTHRLNITAYLLSGHIEQLYIQNYLDLRNLDKTLESAIHKSKEIIRSHLREKLHMEASEFIQDLKKENIYPYQLEAENEIEKAERQVFDIVALNVNSHLPDFEKQDNSSKKFILSLIKEALENDPNGFQRIFKEVLDLPKEKREELNEILEKTSLDNILDVMKEITERLRILYELKLILFDSETKRLILERRHLHKIVRNETWIFGDDYTYGADDVSLRNVLKEYLKFLGRDNFEEVIKSKDNISLEDDIPDICIWKQFNRGKAGHFENLVIELKRPTKIIGSDELNQIKRYAREVADDTRFPKDKTKWLFILLATKLNKDAEFDCNQEDREFGHISTGTNVNVHVKLWGTLLNEAEARHEYLRKQLNYSITEENEGIQLLKKKYAEYLPDSLKNVV